ncbi:putative late blight resistance protein homolog R1B-17 [Coffea arabica]|uniref:Late blight resistance protein homolog R1B-17 n=1 Tax=Coffea arabica TaxID=13443 RepID=A0ABM4VZI4_COFAR
MDVLFTCVETPLMSVAWALKHRSLPSLLRDQVLALEKELRFLRTFLICIGTSKDIMAESSSIIGRFEDAFGKANEDLISACRTMQEKFSGKELYQAACAMLEMAKNFQPEIREAYGSLLKLSRQQHNIPLDPKLLKGLIDSLAENLTDLVDSEDLIASLKKQIPVLKEKLRFLRNFLDITAKKSIPDQIMQSFLSYVHFSASTAASLSYCCWTDEMDEIVAGGMNIKLSELVWKIMPDTLELMEMYVGLLKASKLATSDDAKTDEVASFAKFLLENFVSFTDNKASMIQEELIFLLSFMIGLQEECTGDLGQISANIKTIAREAGYLEYKHLLNEGTEDQIKEMKHVADKLLEKMKLVKAEILLIELLHSEDSLFVLMRDANAAIHEELKFFKSFLLNPKQDGESFLKQAETVASEVTSLIHSIHGKKFNEEMVTKINLDLFWLLEKIKLFRSEIHLNELKNKEANSLFPMRGDTEILYKGLRSLRAFLMDIPDNDENREDRKLYLTYLEAAISELQPLDLPLRVNKITEDLVDVYLAKGNAVANDSGSQNCSVGESMMQKGMQIHPFASEVLQLFGLFKAHMGQIYLQDVKSLQSNLPRTDDLGFINSLLQNLRELLNHDANHAASFAKQHLQMVCEELEFLQSFLVKSVKQKNDRAEVRDLWTCITKVAYEAEWVIDSFVLRDGPFTYHMLWLSAVMEYIKLIKAKAICVQEKYYNEVQDIAKPSDRAPSSVSTPELDEVVVGFNNEEKEIKGVLTRGEMKMDIISIVGMPGLGKTTLAKKVYNSPSVASHFHVRAWCCISQKHQRRQLLLDILCQIIEITDQIRRLDDDDIATKLYQSLKRKRYLIVMDDLWEIGAWSDMRQSFPDDKNGSRVLFTSRQQDLGLQAKEDGKTFPLCPLSQDESWQLLQKRVFCEVDCPNTLLEVGERIAENCKGIPLSLVVIAGLLARTEKTPDRWKQVLEKLSSYIFADPEGGCMHALGLSYEHLPDNLKSCFLYFGAFPEDAEIPAWKLSCLWIAEGFVQNTDSKSLEDAAEYCLSELVSRSLVIVAKKRSNGKVKSFRVHDLLRELCLKKAKEENFFQLIHGYKQLFSPSREAEGLDYDADSNNSFSSTPLEYQDRRLCICSKRKLFSLLKPCGRQVRSLLFFASNEIYPRTPYDISFICQNFKLVRVLDVESINMGDSFPIGLELLVQLKYLAVRGDVKSVPSSICKLWNLETFLVKALRGEVLVPSSFLNMKRLRRVHINDRVAFSSLNDKSDCSSLVENMETFSTPALSYGSVTEKMLRRFPSLRKLRCIFVESSDYSKKFTKFPVLDFLTHLESLKILYHGMVSQPCEFNLPLNLKKLTLSKFRLPWSQISTIGKLPHLEVLKLLSRAFDGQIWEMTEGEFQSLKYLKFDNLWIAQWKASNDHLPCLRHLVLQRCKKLEEVPSSLGDIRTLERIEVHWCSQSAAVSVKEIEDEQRDIGNEELMVLISGMEQ